VREGVSPGEPLSEEDDRILLIMIDAAIITMIIDRIMITRVLPRVEKIPLHPIVFGNPESIVILQYNSKTYSSTLVMTREEFFFPQSDMSDASDEFDESYNNKTRGKEKKLLFPRK
jgi:hypothetical protein